MTEFDSNRLSPPQGPHGEPITAPPSGALDDDLSYIRTRARIAVYDDLLTAPRIIDVEPAPTIDYIEGIASSTYEYSHKLGGSLPYTVIREIAENFIHAHFKECTVSVLDGGNTLRFSDQGPGIEKKALVLQPGVTSATAGMKRFIKGVGSGFPIVREYLEHINGYLSLDDNAVEGAVVTLSVAAPAPVPAAATAAHQAPPAIHLEPRDDLVLKIVMQEGAVGPSDIASPLGTSVATAHRLLEKLERLGLLERTTNKKRILSNAGFGYITSL